MKYGILGHPLGHSFSPRIHTALGNPGYGFFDLPEEALSAFFEAREFEGINVTRPYKRTVIPYLTRISENARRIGAVNTIVKQENGSLTGYNTDYDGMKYALELANIDVRRAKALILGSGGTSRTAAAALADLGADEILIVSRHPKNEQTRNSRPSISAQKLQRSSPLQISYEEAYKYHPDADILVNTTPVGMYPDNGEAPLNLHKFPNLRGVLDVIYNPLRTALLLQAEELGIPYSSGLPMLVAQAVAAHLLYFPDAVSDSGNESLTGSTAAGGSLPDPDLLASLSRPILRDLRRECTNLVLIGMPGSGKSTIGQMLADKLGRPFVDLDLCIEETEGRHPSDIIINDGENAFRRIESGICAREGKETGRVIATGGGIVLRNENYASLKQNGFIILLERNLAALPREGRPLSRSTDVLAGMARVRQPFYRAFADTVIDNNAAPEKTVEAILRLMR